MRTRPRTQGANSGPARSVAAFVTLILLVAGCASPTDTSVPTDGPPPTTAAPRSTPSGVLPSTGPPSAAPSEIGWAWADAGMMTVARIQPHAILLGDGRVLVVGNEWYPEEGGETRDLGTAELWVPATGTWQRTESLNRSRSDFAAVPLADGRALVIGGTNPDRQSYSSAYVYDPDRETWSKVGLMDKARTAPTAALLPDGRVLVAGGYFVNDPGHGSRTDPDAVLAAYRPAAAPVEAPPKVRLADVDVPIFATAMATAELFDPDTGEWSPTGSLKFARYGAAAVTLADGRVLIVGSGDGSGVAIDSRAFDNAEIYDPSTGRFGLAGELPEIDRSAVADLGVPLPDGDPAPADNGALVALDDGGALLVGHAHWWKHEGEITRSFRFDRDSDRWSEASQPFATAEDHDTGTSSETPGELRLEAAVARLPDGRVLVAGGAGAYQTAAQATASAELFDPVTNAWSPVAPMEAPRAQGTAVVLSDGSVLIVGESAGYDDDGDPITPQSAIRFAPGH